MNNLKKNKKRLTLEDLIDDPSLIEKLKPKKEENNEDYFDQFSEVLEKYPIASLNIRRR